MQISQEMLFIILGVGIGLTILMIKLFTKNKKEDPALSNDFSNYQQASLPDYNHQLSSHKNDDDVPNHDTNDNFIVQNNHDKQTTPIEDPALSNDFSNYQPSSLPDYNHQLSSHKNDDDVPNHDTNDNFIVQNNHDKQTTPIDETSYDFLKIPKDPTDFWSMVPLRRNCPAIRGFRTDDEVEREAELYYQKYGQNSFRRMPNHFCMFSRKRDDTERRYEYVFVKKLLELGASPDILHTINDDKFESDWDDNLKLNIFDIFDDVDIEILKLLLNYGYDLNKDLKKLNDEEEEEDAVLFKLAYSWEQYTQPEERLNYFLSLGCNLHAKDKDGFEPVVFASCEEAYRAFTRHGAILDRNTIANASSNPLYSHTEDKDLFMLKKLIEIGCDPNQCDEDTIPVILQADNLQVYQFLRNAGAVITPEMIEKYNDSEDNPINNAIEKGDIEMIKEWLSVGFKMPASIDGYMIPKIKDVHLLEFLKSHNVELSVKDEKVTMDEDLGYTDDSTVRIFFLNHAYNSAIAEWLINHHIDSCDNFIYGPLLDVSNGRYDETDYSDLIRYYIRIGYDINEEDCDYTPLSKYLDDSCIDLDETYEPYLKGLQTMIDCGADVTHRNSDGIADLSYAANIETIRILYKKWIELYPQCAIDESKVVL